MKDLYVDLLKYYRFMLGKIPKEESFLAAVKETVSREDLRVFFLLPFTGWILEEKLQKKAHKLQIPAAELGVSLEHMLMEGFIQRYTRNDGRAFERGNIAFMSEQQVRKPEDSPRRTAYAELMDALIEGDTGAVPNRTPYYRVLPVEETVATTHLGEIAIDTPVPDSRAVLPLDIVSNMVKAEPLVGVAQCYCRKARQVVGKACRHPLETCFVFNELAESLIDAGIARKLDHEEALKILNNCEQAGLVHFVDNAEGRIKSLCNCCSCSCVIMGVIKRGGSNAGAPSRYIIEYDSEACLQCATCAQYCPTAALNYYDQRLYVNPERCIGCGLCVSNCRGDALKLVPRKKYPRIFPSNEALWGHIARESIIGLAVNKIKRRQA